MGVVVAADHIESPTCRSVRVAGAGLMLAVGRERIPGCEAQSALVQTCGCAVGYVSGAMVYAAGIQAAGRATSGVVNEPDSVITGDARKKKRDDSTGPPESSVVGRVRLELYCSLHRQSWQSTGLLLRVDENGLYAYPFKGVVCNLSFDDFLGTWRCVFNTGPARQRLMFSRVVDLMSSRNRICSRWRIGVPTYTRPRTLSSVRLESSSLFEPRLFSSVAYSWSDFAGVLLAAASGCRTKRVCQSRSAARQSAAVCLARRAKGALGGERFRYHAFSSPVNSKDGGQEEWILSRDKEVRQGDEDSNVIDGSRWGLARFWMCRPLSFRQVTSF
nr:hypothetical protein Iba_chr15dCG4880 [Ipomoea batatas]